MNGPTANNDGFDPNEDPDTYGDEAAIDDVSEESSDDDEMIDDVREEPIRKAPEFSRAVVHSDRPSLDDAPLRALPSAHGEQMRKLRTEILIRHGYNNAAPLAFAVVSTSAGDGRSLLAAELAVSFAQLGRPTLLIDADMRTPMHRRLFGDTLETGLAQALASGETPELNRVESYPTLSVLGAGDESNYNPTELLSNKRFQRLVESLKNLFDFIIIDTPPFIPFSDAQIVAAIVGQVLTLHRAPQNSYKETRIMLSSLSRSGADVIGAVMNRI